MSRPEEQSQRTPAPHVALDVRGDAEALAAAVGEGLGRFGLRAAPATEGAPAGRAALRLEGTCRTRYDDASVFGRPVAHNYHGELELVLRDAEGRARHRVAYRHSWGRLPKQRSRAEVRATFRDMLFTPVVAGLLRQEPVRRLLPPERRADAARWAGAEAERLRERLSAAMSESEVAAYLEDLAAPAGGNSGHEGPLDDGDPAPAPPR